MEGFFLDENQHLSVVGNDLEEVPAQLGEQYGNKAKRLDLSYNALTYVLATCAVLYILNLLSGNWLIWNNSLLWIH